MSKILIENYRGFDIEFETSNEKFQCVCTEDATKESNSFAAVKKFIDEYKKSNQDFKPFWIEPTPRNSYKEKKLKVIGLRKDGRFVAENEKGEKEQISDYDLSDYMLLKEENQEHLVALKNEEEKERLRDLEYGQTRKDIIAKMNIVSLKDYKKELLS